MTNDERKIQEKRIDDYDELTRKIEILNRLESATNNHNIGMHVSLSIHTCSDFYSEDLELIPQILGALKHITSPMIASFKKLRDEL